MINIINKSSVSIEEILPLIKFLKPYFHNIETINLIIKNHDSEKKLGVAGWARRSETGANSILLKLNKKRKFNKSETYQKKVGPIYYNNWNENIIMVLAHEFRHIDQFMVSKPRRPKNLEYDAELYGKLILEEYKKRIN